MWAFLPVKGQSVVAVLAGDVFLPGVYGYRYGLYRREVMKGQPWRLNEAPGHRLPGGNADQAVCRADVPARGSGCVVLEKASAV